MPRSGRCFKRATKERQKKCRVFGGQLEARAGAVELGANLGHLLGRAGEGAEAALGVFALGARGLGVDLFGELGEVGEDGDAVGVDLDEAARDEQAARRRALRVGEDAGLERRDERGVAGQDAQLAVRARHGHRVHLLREKPPLRRDDIELESHKESGEVGAQNAELRAGERRRAFVLRSAFCILHCFYSPSRAMTSAFSRASSMEPTR